MVFINGKIYHDGVDISQPELYRQVDTSGELPKTSAPFVVEFQTFFQSVPGDLIYVGIGSKLSVTFQNAFLASETLPERKITEYLYKGGRCLTVENIVGSLLKIRPVIEVKPDGNLDVKEKTRGTCKKALAYLLDDFKAHLPDIDLHRVFATHSGCDDDGKFLAGELRNMAPIEEIYNTTVGCTIASHCGPGTIGILYLEK